MKILIVHNHYQQVGGEHVAIQVQMALLREYGHTLIPYMRESNEINQYGLIRKALFFPNTFFSRRTYREIRALVERERPDIAHVHNVFPLISPAAYHALHDAGVPIVQTLHNFRLMCSNALFYTHNQICERCKGGNTLHAIRLKCYRQSTLLSALYATTIGLHRRFGTWGLIDRFIALTEFTQQKMLESGLAPHHKIAVLGNTLTEPLPKPGSFEAREPYFVFLGRLSHEKGVDILLDAMQGIEGITLKILGSGPQRPQLEAQIERLGLRHVEFLDHIVGEEKWHILRQATALVLPSVCYEQFPFTALESLTVGTPVVASNIGGLPYIVDDGKTGLLFEAGNSNDLHNKLLWIIEHQQEALEMGRRGVQAARKRWSAMAHYDGLMKIYQDVIESRATEIHLS